MSNNQSDHDVDSFLKERLDTEVPPEVDARLRQRLASFRERMESRDADREPWWRVAAVARWPVPVRFAVPAALLLLAALMFWPTSGVNNGPLVFADVLEQIREFRPYACTYTWQYEGRRPYGWRLMRDSLTRRREERDDGSILVFDLSQEPLRTLTLFPEQKLAIEEILTGAGPAQDPDILRILGGMRNGNAEDLGMKKIGRRLAQGFHAPDKVNDFTIWADPATGLPIRVELRQDILERTLIMSDFEWDIKLDESLFSTRAPEGYTVQSVEQDGVYPTEQHLVEGLRAIATLLGGEFPTSTEFLQLRQKPGAYVERNVPSATEEEIESLRTCVRRAFNYIDLLKDFYEVSELRYVGEGVEFGDAESPVLWWLFKALETYRVVYGDLSVRDVPLEDVPDLSGDQSSDLLVQADGDFLPYVCTYTVKDEGKPDHTYRLMRWSLSRRREVHPEGKVTVVDLSQRPMIILELFPEKKRAIEITLVGGGPAKDPDMLKMANEAQYESGKDLGVQLVEGRKARGFRTLSPGNDIVFWIDEETELPLRIDNTHTGTGRKIIMSEFEWDVQFDESLFSTTVPEGYAVKRLER